MLPTKVAQRLPRYGAAAVRKRARSDRLTEINARKTVLLYVRLETGTAFVEAED